MQTVPLTFTGGLDRSRTPSQSSLNSLYTLAGFRQSQTNVGELEQVPYLYQSIQRSQGTYWNGTASATEPATSAVTAMVNDIVVSGGTAIFTDYVAWTSSGIQMQVFLQFSYPAAVTINTQCFIVINSVAGLALTLGNTLDIVIDGATTFKYRKNGGAYTTLQACSTTGTSIDSGNVTVYFMASSGFTVADTWQWQRTDRVGDNNSPTLKTPLIYEYFRSGMFYLSNASRMMQMTTDANSVEYIITVGYRPVFGLGFTIFFDHLVVTSYATPLDTVITSKVVANSDNLDIHVFFSTDVNEADTFTVPNAALVTLVGPLVYNKTLYIFTSGTLYYTSYLGLPTVFDYVPYIEFPAGTNQTALYSGDKFIATGSEKGVYIVAHGFVYLFNGSQFTRISDPLNDLATVVRSIHFVGSTLELYVRDGNNILYIYQERLGTWYKRFASFDAETVACSCVANDGRIGIGSRKVLTTATALNTPVYDGGQGTTFQTPTITTQILKSGGFDHVKETSGLYLVANGSAQSSPYSAGTLTVKWYIADRGYITGSASTGSASTWTYTATSGAISDPRVAFRGLALQLELTGTGGLPPRGVSVIELDLALSSWSVPKAIQ